VVAERIDLSGGSLRRSRFLQSTLDDANLRGVDLSFTGLVEVHFNRADLTGADLSCAHFEMTEFNDAKLKHAKLAGVDLRAAGTFYSVDLEGADLRGAFYDDATDFPDGFDPVRAGCVPVGRGMNMRGADLRGRVLPGSFDDADLQDADLEGADLMGATLRRADLRGANITKTRFAWHYGGHDTLNCAKFEDTIMPDGERWTGCGTHLPEKYRR
jgi:uncharacterized protein YjbI with pentapeptide repeats